MWAFVKHLRPTIIKTFIISPICKKVQLASIEISCHIMIILSCYKKKQVIVIRLSCNSIVPQYNMECTTVIIYISIPKADY